MTCRREHEFHVRTFAIAVLVLAVTPSLAAQRGVGGSRGFGSVSASRGVTPGFVSARGYSLTRNLQGTGFRRGSPYSSLPFLLDDPLALDDLYSSGYPVSSQPPVELLQALHQLGSGGLLASTLGSPRAGEVAPAAPLMIELQGDRYVRVNDAAADGEASAVGADHPAPGGSVNYSSPRVQSEASAVQSATARAPELPKVILIFGDGHREEIRDYTIANGKLYVHGDLYTDGYWNKQIDLASLNLPQTLQANASRNVNFVLPSSPNEVIARF